MTYLDHWWKIEQRAKQEADAENEPFEMGTKESIVKEHCPGLFFDHAPTATPYNNTHIKCTANPKERNCVGCWNQEYLEG